MTRLFLVCAAALALSTAPAAVAAETTPPDLVLDRDTAEAIRTMLTDRGYKVRHVKADQGLYEAYVLLDGRHMELYLDPRRLQVVRIRRDN